VAAPPFATAPAESHDELFRLAYFDALTGAPNLVFLDAAVKAALADSSHPSFALAALEIDRFAPIKEYYGRKFADALVTGIASRLNGLLQAGDLLARGGGDRFYLLLAAPQGGLAIEARIEDIAEQMRHPFVVGGHEILVSASIGVSVRRAEGADDSDIRDQADDALKLARRSERGHLAFYDPSAEYAPRKAALHEQHLRQALRERRILCAFQPKVDFRANKVVGLEALMRWRDENGELRSPGDLLSQAHLTGLIDDVTSQVFEDAIASLPLIDAAYGADVTIGFNISAAQAGDLRFMRHFASRLKASGSGPRFMVEITEEAFVSAGRFQSDVAPLIRDAGAKISIDDFGVGYSSLASLADIVADELKVDRSFIVAVHERPRSQSLLRAIELIGSALHMRVVVEGVETAEELAFLRDFTGISVAQGYYFSKPIVFETPAARSDERAGIAIEPARQERNDRKKPPMRRIETRRQ
jgi:diguanylate cyclase (GGDEF)-like protein